METPMNTKILAIATALAASAALTPAAEAGGNGVRLGFGFPMGSFTATPARGGGYEAAPSAGQAQAMAARKKAAMQAAAARRAAGSASKVAKTTEETTDKAVEESKDTAESTPTGSTALIQTAKQPVASEASSSPKADPVATTVAEVPEPVAEEKKTVESSEESAAKVSEAKDLPCKKFFPAVGLTLSVGCKE
jgi:hypothetical protein